MPPDAIQPGQKVDTPPVGVQPVVEEPKWLAAIPDEGMREEAKKSYMLNEDYTKKTQGLAEKEKTWGEERTKYQDIEKNYNTMNSWYQKDYMPFHARFTPEKWKAVDAYLNGQGALPANANANVAPTNSQDHWEGYDLLSGSEQAVKMADHLRTTMFEPELKKERDNTLKIAENARTEVATFIQSYNRINNDAVQIALKEQAEGRVFPIQEYVEEQLKILNGQIDAPALAFQKVTGDHRQKDLEKQWYEKGKADREQEYVNQQQNPGALLNTTIPTFPGIPKTREEITATSRAKAQKDGIPW